MKRFSALSCRSFGPAMLTLRRVGASIQVQRTPEGILIGSGGEYTEVSLENAGHLFVDAIA